MKKLASVESIGKTQSRFGNVVSEDSAVYETKSNKDICFLSEDLTPAEMVALGNYQAFILGMIKNRQGLPF